MEAIAKEGVYSCPEYLIDSFGHIYNGYYTELLRLILIKEDIISQISGHLKIHDFSFERFLRRETIRYKKEIKCCNQITYKLSCEFLTQKVKIVGRLYIDDTIEATNIELSFGEKQKCQSKPAKEWSLVGKAKTLHPIFPDYRNSVLGVSIYKSLFEIERGRFLSKALQGDQNYFGMLSEKSIAFISYSSVVKYYGEIKLGEFFYIKTYRKKDKEALKISFFQDLLSMNGMVVARITTDIIQIDTVKKRPQITDFRGTKMKKVRRLLGPVIVFGEKRLKRLERKLKPIRIHLKNLTTRKKKSRKTQ